MKKISFRLTLMLVIVLIGTMALTACSSVPKDLTKNKAPEKIVEESFAKWYELNNYDMDMSTTMKMSMGSDVLNMSMTGKATVFQKPMKLKMIMDASFPGMNEEKMTIEQYMVQEDQVMTIYQLVQGQWQKMVIDDPALAQMASMDPRENLKLFMDNLTKAEVLGEEQVGDKNTVKIDLVASGKIFDQILEDTAGQALGLGNDLLSTDILAKIGDLRYTVWIDKATLETVKCQMDLSENMQNLGKAMAEDPNMPAEMKDIFSDVEMTMEYTVLNHNKAQDFTIPEEAKNAKEIPLNNI